MFKVNKVYAAIVQTQNGSYLFYKLLPFEEGGKKTFATAFSCCFITNLQKKRKKSCIIMFYTN